MRRNRPTPSCRFRSERPPAFTPAASPNQLIAAVCFQPQGPAGALPTLLVEGGITGQAITPGCHSLRHELICADSSLMLSPMRPPDEAAIAAARKDALAARERAATAEAQMAQLQASAEDASSQLSAIGT